MKSFTSSNLDALRKDINKALEGVAKKHSIVLEIGGIKYSSDRFHTKLEAFIQDANTSGMNAKQIEGLENLKTCGSLYNVTEKDLGKTFTSNGQTFKFAGLMPSRPKYPVLGENVRNGKMFKFTESILTKIRE